MKKSLSRLDVHLGYTLRRVSNAVSQGFARKVEAEGVTVAEWVLLRTLFDVERMAPSELANEMKMTRGAISKLADRLIEKGLIEQGDNLHDRRAHTLSLNVAGRSLVPRLAGLADDNDVEFFGLLTKEERQSLEYILQKVAKNRRLAAVPID